MDGKISHAIWNDMVFPTYVDDVCKLMLKAGSHQGKLPLVLSLPGQKLTNQEMVEKIQKVFGLDIPISISGKLADTKIDASGFLLLDEKQDDLTNFEAGLKLWCAKFS
jgi:nucleoside-diphosphate-sugar epimerase